MAEMSSSVEAPPPPDMVGTADVDVIPRRPRREAIKPAWMRSGDFEVEM